MGCSGPYSEVSNGEAAEQRRTQPVHDVHPVTSSLPRGPPARPAPHHHHHPARLGEAVTSNDHLRVFYLSSICFLPLRSPQPDPHSAAESQSQWAVLVSDLAMSLVCLPSSPGYCRPFVLAPSGPPLSRHVGTVLYIYRMYLRLHHSSHGTQNALSDACMCCSSRHLCPVLPTCVYQGVCLPVSGAMISSNVNL